jgi:hypothetical protein
VTWFVWTIVAVLIAGCVVVTVQMGEKNVVDREIDVNQQSDKEKERSR